MNKEYINDAAESAVWLLGMVKQAHDRKTKASRTTSTTTTSVNYIGSDAPALKDLEISIIFLMYIIFLPVRHCRPLRVSLSCPNRGGLITCYKYFSPILVSAHNWKTQLRAKTLKEGTRRSRRLRSQLIELLFLVCSYNP